MKKIIISALMGGCLFSENVSAVNPPIITTAQSPSLFKSPLIASYKIGKLEPISLKDLTGEEISVGVNLHEKIETEEALTSIAKVNKELKCLSIDCEVIDKQIIDIIIQILEGNQYLDALDLKSTYSCVTDEDYIRFYEELTLHPSVYQVNINVNGNPPAYYEIFTKKLESCVKHKDNIAIIEDIFESVQMDAYYAGEFETDEETENDIKAAELCTAFQREQDKIKAFAQQMKEEIAHAKE